MLEVWLPLLICIALGVFWYRVMGLRERAVAQARKLCTRHGVQLLDDSVALHRLRLSWRRGGLRALREYRFDTSLGGHDRQTACLTLLGNRLVSSCLPMRRDSDTGPPAPGTTPPSGAPALLTHAHAQTDNVIPITRAHKTLH